MANSEVEVSSMIIIIIITIIMYVDFQLKHDEHFKWVNRRHASCVKLFLFIIIMILDDFVFHYFPVCVWMVSRCYTHNTHDICPSRVVYIRDVN